MTWPGARALDLLARPTWHDVLLGALAQWLIFVPLLGVLIALAAPALNPTSGLLVALFSGLYSAPVGAVVTLVLGVPLAKLLARWLARTRNWRLHLVAFLGLGAILAAILIHAYMLAVGRLWDSPAWWGGMSIFLPIVSAAALSVGAGWSIAWRRAVMRELAREPAGLLVDA